MYGLALILHGPARHDVKRVRLCGSERRVRKLAVPVVRVVRIRAARTVPLTTSM